MLPKLPIDDCQLEMNQPVSFSFSFDPDLQELTEQKLLHSRFPEEQTDFREDDWSQGSKVSRIRELAEHWRTRYSWEDQERRINEIFNHYLIKMDVPEYGLVTLHYTHSMSSSPEAIPLLFVHGWPGSFLEASKIVNELTVANPDNDKHPTFHVVAPSIPGFGFSPAPIRSRVGPEVVAHAFKKLMTDVLGYPHFVTQGGDFGAFITRWMAIHYPDVVRAQHLNMFPVSAPTLRSAPFAYIRWCLSGLLYSTYEKNLMRISTAFEEDQSAYLHLQATRPQTLGFALGDSPIGLLAWVVEKLQSWIDVPESLDNDDIINLVMMHWIQAATPGLRFHREAFGERREAERAFEAYVKIPTGVSVFPKEILACPKDWARQVANIQFWRQHERGGHFAALECPEDLVNDLRDFFSSKAAKTSLTRQS
ncbi:epoxide hydrolase [Colletotrichum karsti]|uniref:Epoxide hydrolase n=1 Tax=Colletotrichum karsti TaxID=1095194 RepID=A0A9P6LFV4_9PEZI|nr:epoxide hydrolase [Colletotrichum karsti]KAF9870975.1 epoxide hydrolase [Colletotrichum karsti]